MIGLGYVGLAQALAFAEAGVLGLDIDAAKSEAIGRGESYLPTKAFWKLRRGLGSSAELTVLLEVLIKGKSGADMEALHQGKTGTVGEAELFVGKGLEDSPGCFNNLRGEVFAPEDTAGPDIFAELDSYRMASPEPDDRVAFIQDIVTGDEGLAGFEGGIAKRQSVLMVSISAVLNGEKGRCIHKNHSGLDSIQVAVMLFG